MIRVAYIALACIIILTLRGCTDCSEPTLQISLLLDKQVYVIGDDIFATLTLSNLQKETMLMNRRMAINWLEFKELGEVAFRIQSPNGQDIPQVVYVNIKPPANNYFIILDREENITENFQLNRYYSPLVDPGKYSVTAYYRNYWNPDDGRTAWQGMISSNTVTFIVEQR